MSVYLPPPKDHAGLYKIKQNIERMHTHFSRIFLPKQGVLSDAHEIYWINPPRKTFLIYFIFLVFVEFAMTILSVGALAYLLMITWPYFAYCVYAFSKLGQIYGYSSGLILFAFLLVTIFIVLIKIYF